MFECLLVDSAQLNMTMMMVVMRIMVVYHHISTIIISCSLFMIEVLCNLCMYEFLPIWHWQCEKNEKKNW